VPPTHQIVAGVDGCRGGWSVARLRVGARSLRLIDLTVVTQLAELISDQHLTSIAIDMPIGLPESGSKEADVLARARLRPHGSRVFPTPIRAALPYVDDYDRACEVSREVHGKALSRQAWNILGKIAEVDRLADDERLVEVHPEVSFAAMAGAVVSESKKTAAGRQRRIELLEQHIAGLGHLPAGDDALDALAAAWTAARIVRGTSQSLPPEPPLDSKGRPMRIVV